MTDEKELPCVTIQKVKRSGSGAMLEESFVSVKHKNINKCVRIAKDIFGGDLNGRVEGKKRKA